MTTTSSSSTYTSATGVPSTPKRTVAKACRSPVQSPRADHNDRQSYSDDMTNLHVGAASPRRQRIDSRDIKRSDSLLFPNDDQPPSYNRAPWLEQKLVVFASYVAVLATIQVSFFAILGDNDADPRTVDLSWTCTNVVHFAITLFVLHWMKGSIYDTQGEFDAYTVWEQLERTHGSGLFLCFLQVIPTLLCYCACHMSNYNAVICSVNITLWILTMLGKLPFMDGIRVLGVNGRDKAIKFKIVNDFDSNVPERTVDSDLNSQDSSSSLSDKKNY